MTLHGVIYGFKDDKVVPLRATMEIHSSGSAGFTLSVLDITGASAKQPWPVPIAELSSRYLTGPELPVRIEGHDSKFWTVDVHELRWAYTSEELEWVATAGWLGRRRRWMWRSTKSQQRRRTMTCPLSRDANTRRLGAQAFLSAPEGSLDRARTTDPRRVRGPCSAPVGEV